MKALHATLRALTLLTLPFALLACGEDGTGPDASVAGTYTLERVNGAAPPTVVYSQTQQGTTFDFQIESGRLRLADGRYDAELIFSVLVDGEPYLASDTLADSGTYSVSGDRLTLTSSDPEPGEEPAVATVNGDAITLTDEDPELGTLELVFRR